MKPLLTIAILVGFAAAGYFTRDHWLALVQYDEPAAARKLASDEAEPTDAIKKIILTDQAIANLHLTAKPARLEDYWRSIQVPGMIVDRPGRSDRGVITPVTGVVTEIYHFPGETVSPGEKLFTVRLLSESLHTTQSELFETVQNIQLMKTKRERLAAAGAAIPRARVIEVENEIIRLEIAIKSCRQELLNRALTAEQIDEVAKGNFVSETAVVVPSPARDVRPLTPASAVIQMSGRQESRQPSFEVQQLQVDIGHQVQAGQTLCLLANHQLLTIEGRAFRDETSLLEKSVQEGWPVKIDFQENAQTDWPPFDETFYIRHIANNIDPINRTFAFQIPMENQSRVVILDGNTQMLWRFRPGQKVRILVPIEKIENVFVLPAGAVTRELAEAFVFTQNVNTFERKAVRVLAEDRQSTVLAHDGSLLPGSFVVQNAADQLNRMTKSQSDNSLPEGYHIHADGSLHKNEDE